MIWETERLILRRHRKEDLQDLYEYLSDPEVVTYEPNLPMDMDQAVEELAYRIESDEMVAVELKQTHKLIGNVYLGRRDFDSLEIGFVFNGKYQHQGYARESCEKLIDFAFSAGIHRIYAECDPENGNSWRLLERLGFSREAHLLQNVYFWKDDKGDPIWKNTYIYALLNH